MHTLTQIQKTLHGTSACGTVSVSERGRGNHECHGARYTVTESNLFEGPRAVEGVCWWRPLPRVCPAWMGCGARRARPRLAPMRHANIITYVIRSHSNDGTRFCFDLPGHESIRTHLALFRLVRISLPECAAVPTASNSSYMSNFANIFVHSASLLDSTTFLFSSMGAMLRCSPPIGMSSVSCSGMAAASPRADLRGFDRENMYGPTSIKKHKRDVVTP